MKNTRFDTDDDDELAEVEVEQTEVISSFSIKSKWSSIPKRYKLALIIILVVVILAVAVIAILLPFAFQATRSKTREYYLQAEILSWNYAPLGYNAITGNPWTLYEATYATSTENHISSYIKGVFRAYTDNSFSSRVERSADEDYMGFYGPVLRGAVGETISITVKNTLDFPISFQITGLQISNDMDGRSYGPNVGTPSTSIGPGQTFTYLFVISEQNGPESGKFSSRIYSYSSGVHEPSGYHTGLAGVMIISSKGETPSDVDQEIILITSMVDESQSEYLCTNVAPVFFEVLNCSQPNINQQIIAHSPPAFLESNRKYAINGFLYGNMPPVQVQLGATTRWYVVNLGPEAHSILWSGQVLQLASGSAAVAVAVPASAQIVDIAADFPGTWLIEAYGSAQAKGMSGLFVIGESQ